MTYGGFDFDCGSLSQLGSFYLETTATILWIGVLHFDAYGDCIAINSLYGNGHSDTIAERGVSMAIATTFEKSVYND